MLHFTGKHTGTEMTENDKILTQKLLEDSMSTYPLNSYY